MGANEQKDPTRRDQCDSPAAYCCLLLLRIGWCLYDALDYSGVLSVVLWSELMTLSRVLASPCSLLLRRWRWILLGLRKFYDKIFQDTLDFCSYELISA